MRGYGNRKWSYDKLKTPMITYQEYSEALETVIHYKLQKGKFGGDKKYFTTYLNMFLNSGKVISHPEYKEPIIRTNYEKYSKALKIIIQYKVEIDQHNNYLMELINDEVLYNRDTTLHQVAYVPTRVLNIMNASNHIFKQHLLKDLTPADLTIGDISIIGKKRIANIKGVGYRIIDYLKELCSDAGCNMKP